jgi:hypothetical protein
MAIQASRFEQIPLKRSDDLRPAAFGLPFWPDIAFT